MAKWLDLPNELFQYVFDVCLKNAAERPTIVACSLKLVHPRFTPYCDAYLYRPRDRALFLDESWFRQDANTLRDRLLHPAYMGSLRSLKINAFTSDDEGDIPRVLKVVNGIIAAIECMIAERLSGTGSVSGQAALAHNLTSLHLSSYPPLPLLPHLLRVCPKLEKVHITLGPWWAWRDATRVFEESPVALSRPPAEPASLSHLSIVFSDDAETQWLVYMLYCWPLRVQAFDFVVCGEFCFEEHRQALIDVFRILVKHGGSSLSRFSLRFSADEVTAYDVEALNRRVCGFVRAAVGQWEGIAPSGSTLSLTIPVLVENWANLDWYYADNVFTGREFFVTKP